MNSRFVKSHSNYVLKTKHQNIDSGVIYERDITTIGGRDHFAKGQVPIYKSGNFVITVNNDSTAYKKTPSHEWKGNDEGDVWTLDILENYPKDEKSSYDKKIVIKKDYYDLRDFAYFGSCSELIRVSINNILSTFPGELFVPIVYTWVYGDNTFYSESVAKAYSENNGISWPWENQPTPNTIKVTYDDTWKKDTEKEDPDDPNSDTYDIFPTIKRTFKFPDDIANHPEIGMTGHTLFVLDNPFGINIHDALVPNGEDPLKYFADGGIDNYVAYMIDDKTGEWDFDTKYSIEVSDFIKYSDPEKGDFVGINGYCEDELVVTTPEFEQKTYCPGDLMGYVDITIKDGNTEKCKFRVYVFKGDNDSYVYFVDPEYVYKDTTNSNACVLKTRIRPIDDIIEDFYDSLNNFEKILLDRGTNFESTFEIIRESDYGYFVDTQRYIFPTTYGGYNLGSNSSSFNEYLEGLVAIGEYYDERFTDNLWRSMTHEAIKNFDWTYTRHFEPGDEIDYVEGGNKIQKIIRIYGREYDEIRSYIDAIADNNTITYDNINNLPDYFFTDKLEDDGWDVKLVTPFKLTEFVNGEDKTSDITPSEEPTNKHGEDHIDRVFNEVTENVKPYTKYNITSLRYTNCKKWVSAEFYESACTNDDKTDVLFEAKNKLENAIDLEVNAPECACDGDVMELNPKTGEFQRDGYHDDCCNDVKIYSSEKEYTTAEVNSEFLKRFILNSKDILRHKGTIDGIEMLLSLFGLKSKNYVYSNESYFKITNTLEDDEIITTSELTDFGKKYYKKIDLTTAQAYDYDIKEYTLFTKRFTDEYDSVKEMYKMDWINSLKLPSYQTPTSKNDQYIPYQGLPVDFRYEKVPTKTNPNPNRYIYPSFQNYLSYDGGLYYQMNGGWLSKNPFMFDTKNNIIPIDYTSENSKNSMLFTETIKNIKCVQTLDEMLSNKSLATMPGDICQVIDLSGRYAIIDGFVYKVLTEDGFDYFYATIVNNSLSVGSALFTGFVYISNPFIDGQKLKINLDDDNYNGKNIRVYILKKNGKYDVDVHSNSNSISTFTFFENGKYMEGNNFTNYFRINNPDFSNELSVMGWQQLRDDEYEYYLMDSITDYNKGNNPHTGHMNYDKGHEYLTYFSRLFKTAYDNGLFDTSSMGDNGTDIYGESYYYGFRNLVDEDECVKNYDKYLEEDVKCHYFGDYFYNSEDGMINVNYDLNDETYMKNTIRKTILGIGELQKMYYADTVGIKDVDSVTNQIVNTKRVDIDFYLNSDVEYSKEWLEEVKYIDSVILPYLTQVVPSTIILTVNYKKKSDKYCWKDGYIDPDGEKCKAAVVDGSSESAATSAAFSWEDSGFIRPYARFAVEEYDDANSTTPDRILYSESNEGTVGCITVELQDLDFKHSPCVAAKLEYQAGVFNDEPECLNYGCGWCCYGGSDNKTCEHDGACSQQSCPCNSKCYDMPDGLNLNHSCLKYVKYTINANTSNKTRKAIIYWYHKDYYYDSCPSRINTVIQPG